MGKLAILFVLMALLVPSMTGYVSKSKAQRERVEARYETDSSDYGWDDMEYDD